jgi:diadenosine tetraphosphate (Ap4A) HIT family hydrolase
MHATLAKFGYPDSLVYETAHWCVLLRPQQITLGALVLASKADVRAVPELPLAAFADLHKVTNALEAALRKLRDFDKINYILLMMVDPQVHFHVLPRYSAPQNWNGVSFADAGWPGQPDFKSFLQLEPNQSTALRDELRLAFQPANATP